MVSIILHFYDTRYKQSTLYMKTLPPHCLQFEHTASCTMQVQIAIRWEPSPNKEAIAPTTWKVKTLKMGSHPFVCWGSKSGSTLNAHCVRLKWDLCKMRQFVQTSGSRQPNNTGCNGWLKGLCSMLNGSNALSNNIVWQRHKESSLCKPR